MNFIEVFCHTRNATLLINIEKIVLLKQLKIAGGEKEICFIVVEGLNDGKGEVQVHLSMDEVNRMINGEDRKPAGFRMTH